MDSYFTSGTLAKKVTFRRQYDSRVCGGTEAKLFQGLPNMEVSGEIIVYFLRVELQDAFYPEILVMN